MNTPGALSGYKILEVGASAAYAGKLFADHGADVVMVEPPDGSELRSAYPLINGRADDRRSLRFQYIAAGKTSVVVDLETQQGRDLFKDMLAGADLVLDDKPQHWWAERELAFETLKQGHDRLVWCSITPFGQTGPYSRYAGNDLIAMAMGGMASLAGYEDQPTVTRGNLAVQSAALYGAVASLAMLLGRDGTSGAQFIDISMQEVVALGTETAPQFFDLQKVNRGRYSTAQRQAGIGVYPCADGYLMIYAAVGGVGTGWKNLIDWMVESGVEAARQMFSDEWTSNRFKQKSESRQAFADAFDEFARHRTMQELFIEGQRRRIAISPVNGPEQVLKDPHLLEAGAFRHLDIGDKVIPVPGAPFMLSRTPGRIAGPAPKLGGDE